MLRPLHFLKRATRQCTPCARMMSTNQEIHRIPRPDEPLDPNGEFKDFRPPWVYKSSRLLSFTVIPAIALYAVFVHDFGDQDHVFLPARRWAKDNFLTLSPAEAALLEARSAKAQPNASPPEASTQAPP
ncbi:hypothetical protein HGRIS_006258 [Hohenbuehelia grisea]|uniref:Uncharacterized protein n=1 Tax=Hohenbuehelia grisea TaxID=104357 RepID=A0ABR3K0B6_9AGAR